MACVIASCVPTASTTECAPSPFVRSLILATPSSPRSSTMSVAPYSRASCCRDSWRLVAIIPSPPTGLPPRPQLLGGRPGGQPDRAVADYGEGLARAGLGGDGAEPAGAEHVGSGEQA